MASNYGFYHGFSGPADDEDVWSRKWDLPSTARDLLSQLWLDAKGWLYLWLILAPTQEHSSRAQEHCSSVSLQQKTRSLLHRSDGRPSVLGDTATHSNRAAHRVDFSNGGHIASRTYEIAGDPRTAHEDGLEEADLSSVQSRTGICCETGVSR